MNSMLVEITWFFVKQLFFHLWQKLTNAIPGEFPQRRMRYTIGIVEHPKLILKNGH